MPRGDWIKNLTPEQRKERAARMRAAKVAKLAMLQALGGPESERPSVPAPQPVVLATPSELQYLRKFKDLLNKYLTALSGLNGLGMASIIDYCRLCSGGGIHSIGCGCMCHETRKALQEYANEFGPRSEVI